MVAALHQGGVAHGSQAVVVVSRPPLSGDSRLWAVFTAGASGCDPDPVLVMHVWCLELALGLSDVRLAGVVLW
jgi:hypothetical protein